MNFINLLFYSQFNRAIGGLPITHTCNSTELQWSLHLWLNLLPCLCKNAIRRNNFPQNKFSCISYPQNQTENDMELMIYLLILIYNIFDIFMITYFGNEVNLSSDRLLYCLFQSNWYEYQSGRKTILILGERFKQPLELVILKLYPLTLELFTRVCLKKVMKSWNSNEIFR